MKKSKLLELPSSSRDFPQDLLPEVLSRLPVKSLLRFRCVCKSWLSLIHDSDFCRLHLNSFANNHQETHLLSHQSYSTENRCIVRCSKTLKVTSSLVILSNTTYEDSYRWKILSSLDGLFMLAGSSTREGRDVLVLWNPSIQKYRTVPVLPESEISEDVYTWDWHLGFDSVSQDYKYVWVVRSKSSHFIAVYSVGKNSWKKIEIQRVELYSLCQYCTGRLESICLRGILYVLKSVSHVLVSFDLSKETLDFTVLPGELKCEHLIPPARVLTVVDGGSSLAIVTLSASKGCVWVCQSIEGDNKYLNWTKCHSFTCRFPFRPYHPQRVHLYTKNWTKRHSFTHMFPVRQPQRSHLYTKKNGEMLFYKANSAMLFDIETQEGKFLLQDSSYEFPYWAYVESLVLLN